MNKTLFIVLTILFAATTVFAQYGAICIFADPAGTNCNITDNAPGLLEIYVVHMLTTGATASQFYAPKPSCMTGATWISDTNVFPVTIGDSQTGVAIGYGLCSSSPIHLLTITYQTSGATEDHCAYRVLPRQSRPDVEVVDCADNLAVAGGGKIYLNSDMGCVCEEIAPGDLFVSPTTLDFGYYGIQEFFEISHEGSGTLSWSVTPTEPWILANPTSGTNDAMVYVTVDRDALPNGHHEGTISVASNGGSGEVTVMVDVGPTLYVNPRSLYFDATTTEKTFLIQNVGAGTLDWTVSPDSSWMTAHPTSGADDALITVTAYRCGFEPGTSRQGSISVESNGGDDSVSVRADWMATIAVAPNSLSFERDGTLTRTFETLYRCAVSEPVHWTVTADSSWISVSPTIGTGEQEVSVTVTWPSWLGDGEETWGSVRVTTDDGLDSAVVSVRVFDFIQVPTEKKTWGSIKSKFKK